MKRKAITRTLLIIGLLAATGLLINRAYTAKHSRQPVKPSAARAVKLPERKVAERKPSVAKVTNLPEGKWELSVDGAPFFIKGLCFGPNISRRTINSHLAEVKELGANAVRTWGTGSKTAILLDAAEEKDIKVCMGLWLQYHIDYATNDAYKRHALAEISKWVKEYKDHPAVLMWHVGNEVVMELQNYFVEDPEPQRIAYAKFLEEVCQTIHRLDPNHPVASISVWSLAWPYFKEYVPSLDVYGVNIYGGLVAIHGEWERLEIDKPYLVTEYGPHGEWEAAKDPNGIEKEPLDTEKAAAYSQGWNDYIVPNKGDNLGGFAFIYGEGEDFGGVWYNLLMSGKKRPAFYSVKEAYTGEEVTDNKPPVISKMSLSQSSGLAVGSIVRLEVIANDPEGDALNYEVQLSEKYMARYLITDILGMQADGNRAKLCEKYIAPDGKLYLASFVEISEGVFDIVVPTKEGLYKVYISVTDSMNNVSVETCSMKVGNIPNPEQADLPANPALTDIQ